MKHCIPLEEAQEIVLARARPMEGETVHLKDAAGRVLMSGIKARCSFPPFDRVIMDGFALKSSDTRDAGNRLKIIEELPAGLTASKKVEPGTCIMVMTGSALPDGADAVIRREVVQVIDGMAVVPGNVKAGANVAPAGCDMKQGSEMISGGAVVGPGEAALLAAQGYYSVDVYKVPRVAVISTGDELLEVDEPLAPGKIHNSNRYMLMTACREAGVEAFFFGLIPDNLEITKEALVEAGARADLVISTGGVSMGDYDMVRHAITAAADEKLFWKVRMKPGMPVIAAVCMGKLCFGLSGSPAGAMLNFELLVKPVLKKMMGLPAYHPVSVEARLQNRFDRVHPDRPRYLWGKVFWGNGLEVSWNAGGVIGDMIGYNCLVEIPPRSGPLENGDRVRIILTKGAL